MVLYSKKRNGIKSGNPANKGEKHSRERNPDLVSRSRESIPQKEILLSSVPHTWVWNWLRTNRETQCYFMTTQELPLNLEMKYLEGQSEQEQAVHSSANRWPLLTIFTPSTPVITLSSYYWSTDTSQGTFESSPLTTNLASGNIRLCSIRHC